DELLVEEASPAARYIGIAASAVCRSDPGRALMAALRSDDGRLKARALKAVGEIGRAELVGALREALAAEDDGGRFWAAWSAALLGDGAALDVLRRFALGSGPLAERACWLLTRRMTPEVGGKWLRTLGEAPERRRAALVGAGALGDPALVPWLLDCM